MRFKLITNIEIFIFQTCKKNHMVNKWCSQPILNRRLHSGDLLFSSALLLLGCNYQMISLFARFLKLAIPLSVSYLKMQRTYLAPSLDEIWEKEQNQIFLEFADKDLVLLGNFQLKELFRIVTDHVFNFSISSKSSYFNLGIHVFLLYNSLFIYYINCISMLLSIQINEKRRDTCFWPS